MAKVKPTRPAAAKPAAGRPPGAANHKVAPAEAPASRCSCGSTERAPYFNRTEAAIAGIDPSGQPYTHVVWRRTKCQACGQHRVDKTYENRTPGKRK